MASKGRSWVKAKARIANCHFGAILTCSLAFCPLGLHQRGHFVLSDYAR